MKKLNLLSVFFLTVVLTVSAQKTTFMYVISSPENNAQWVNIQMINTSKGEVVQTVYNPAKKEVMLLDVTESNPVARQTNSNETSVTSSTVAAAAYDGVNQQLFFIPLRVPELRWADLRIPTAPQFFTLRSPLLSNLNLNDGANHITRMVIAADKYGYALTNDGNHLFRFSTGKKPEIVDLGNLVDATGNNANSIHNQCSGWGGDLIAGTDGHLYLISHNSNVFKIDVKERMASFIGNVKGLPNGFNTNGAAANQDGRVLISCSHGNQPFYFLDLETLNATVAYTTENPINGSDLASANFAKRPAVNTGQYLSGTSSFDFIHQKISLFPNPVAEFRFQLSFEETETGIHTIQIMDLSGKIILNKIVHISGPRQIEVVNLQQKITKGLYFVKVINQESKTVYTSKIILQ